MGQTATFTRKSDMPTIQGTSQSDETIALTCPLCHAPLDPVHPNECPKCDWVAKERHHGRISTFRDRAAVALSVVPGRGHIYKGYKLTGALYMLGAVFAFWAASVAATATAGFGLLLLPLYWAGVMLQVFWLEDRGITPKPRPK